MGLDSSALKVLKKAIAQKIHRKTFAFHQKTAKLFSRLTFVIYSISIALCLTAYLYFLINQ